MQEKEIYTERPVFIPKVYGIDWSKVNTIEDIKTLLKSLQMTFTTSPDQDFSGIVHLCKEINNDKNSI